MSKLLIISGPTATGKTALAVKIAKKLNGELISADSRQVYQGLDIGVGKDHPKDTPIHLIDVTTPDKIFSVAQFQNLALPVIKSLQSKNILPILVGCSGQYIDSIINPQPSYSVKPNRLFRFFLDKLPLSFLQFTLRTIDFQTFKLLNHSDLFNPRRLIRKIEIKLSHKPLLLKGDLGRLDILHLSLTAPNSILYPRIDSRVEERLKTGHLDELKKLLQKYRWFDPGLKVSCYQVFKPYFVEARDRASLQACIQKWKYLEHRDARHQKTWFKGRSNLHFVDISLPYYPKNVINLVSKWYNKP